MLAYSDKDHLLHVLDVASGKVTDVDKDEYGDITDYRWAPDSRWVTYTKLNESRYSSIYVYSIPEAKAYRLTSGMTNDGTPVFDPKGRYLYFTSNRDFNLTFSGFEFSYVYTDPTRVYVAVLADDGPALFLPQSDEEKVNAPAPAETPKKDDKAPLVVKIDPAGFENRVRAIPGSPGSYGGLETLPNGVLYLAGSGPQTLKFYNIDDRKEETFAENVGGYDISANREKLIVRSGQTYAIINAKPGQKLSDSALNLANLEMKVDPRAEWNQVYADALRILRDWFYDPNMHGVDWKAIGTKYGELLPYVSHRADLDYIFGEIAGELTSGHTYVSSPPGTSKVERVDNGLLGAEIVADSGLFRIAHIFPGENWQDDFRSPLTEPGVRVREGDYILAVDGASTKGVDNFYRLLENKADRVVTLLVNSSPAATGAREEKVRPVKKETNLRYLDWVQSRRAMVDKLSGGRIGYIHLPNTGAEGNRELFKGFYPQVDKQALIIDDRYNGGGFIPDRMIELLERQPLNYWARRNVKPSATPAFSHVGPKAMLINGYSSSGGDALPYYFRERKLGTLIGTRTWGGLIGLSGNPDLMDGGNISAPQFRFMDTAGMWQVEGVGVAPDIEVIDRPELIAAGQDPSLERAVKLLLEELTKNPPKPVVVPPIKVEN
jgi:tricorn protease